MMMMMMMMMMMIRSELSPTSSQVFPRALRTFSGVIGVA